MSRFEFNMSGLRDLMKSPGMQAKLTEAGNAVANAAGGGYAIDPHVAPYTAVCTVYPADRETGYENYKHNVLLKAVGSAGLKLKVHNRSGK